MKYCISTVTGLIVALMNIVRLMSIVNLIVYIDPFEYELFEYYLYLCNMSTISHYFNVIVIIYISVADIIILFVLYYFI